jgi:hypothetical protein
MHGRWIGFTAYDIMAYSFGAMTLDPLKNANGLQGKTYTKERAHAKSVQK